MSWNYRVVAIEHKDQITEQKHKLFGIHEAFYHEKDDKEPHSITQNSMIEKCETIDDLEFQLKKMLVAVKRVKKKKEKILKYEKFSRD